MSSLTSPSMVRRALRFAAILILSASMARAQDATDLVTLELSSTDPFDTSFEDLEAFRAWIGNAQFVSLGEMTHGDGTAILARTRLVRFLNREMGFDLLAFESGVIECEVVMQSLRDGASPRDAASRGIYPVWAESAEIVPLLQTVQESLGGDTPLRLVGFDPQFSSNQLAEYLVMGDWSPLESGGPDAKRLTEIVDRVANLATPLAEADAAQDDAWLRDLLERHQDDADPVWIRGVTSLGFALESRRLNSAAPPVDVRALDASFGAPLRVRAGNVRDRGMAENLLWHARERFPTSKVIVWAANSHVQTSSASRAIGDDDLRKIPMGEHLANALGDDLYTVLATCRAGSWRAAAIRSAAGELIWQGGEHEVAPAGSLPELLHRHGFADGIVDLDRSIRDGAAWLREPVLLRPAFDTGKPVVLTDFCDAVLYLESIAPATPHP